MNGVIGSLILRTGYANKRLGGLQGIHHPTAGALDSQTNKLRLGQLLVTAKTPYFFHGQYLACSLGPLCAQHGAKVNRRTSLQEMAAQGVPAPGAVAPSFYGLILLIEG